MNSLHDGVAAPQNRVDAFAQSPFRRTRIVLDEPATLVAEQAVRVIIDAQPLANPAELPAPDLAELARRTDEALQPTRQAFAESGMTDGELSEFLEIETHAMRGVPYERR